MISNTANWGRWILATVFLASAVWESASDVARMVQSSHGKPIQHFLGWGLEETLVIAVWAVIIWGVLTWKGWAYWLLVVENLLFSFGMSFMFFFGHFEELSLRKKSGFALSILTLTWLATPSVYDQYWKRKQTA